MKTNAEQIFMLIKILENGSADVTAASVDWRALKDIAHSIGEFKSWTVPRESGSICISACGRFHIRRVYTVLRVNDDDQH